MERQAMIDAVRKAALTNSFNEGLDEIGLLTYTDTDDSGDISEWEDRFDHINADGQVVFICGTGDYKVPLTRPLESLTDASLRMIYSCIKY